MGHAYKGTRVTSPRPLSLQAASIFAQGGGSGIVSWVFVYPSPNRWSIDRLIAGQWMRITTLMGATRTAVDWYSINDKASIIGVDASLNPVTQRSNIVIVT